MSQLASKAESTGSRLPNSRVGALLALSVPDCYSGCAWQGGVESGCQGGGESGAFHSGRTECAMDHITKDTQHSMLGRWHLSETELQGKRWGRSLGLHYLPSFIYSNVIVTGT